jgi:hypothetical protein
MRRTTTRRKAHPLDDQRQHRTDAAEGHGARLGRRSIRQRGFVALHGENSYQQFLEHYQEYTDVVGDHFLNLAATTLPTNAYLLTARPSTVAGSSTTWTRGSRACGRTTESFRASSTSTGESAAPGTVVGNAYGWGFSPINPVTGQRENRNRIGWALAGFSNALLVTGDMKYVDAWRSMIAA